jgi:hypothetical protein
LQHSENDIFKDFAPACPSFARGLRGDARSGDLPQLVVAERQAFGSSLAVACRGRIEEAGHIGPNRRFYQPSAADPREDKGDGLELPAPGGYQQLKDVSFLAARSITCFGGIDEWHVVLP